MRINIVNIIYVDLKHFILTVILLAISKDRSLRSAAVT